MAEKEAVVWFILFDYLLAKLLILIQLLLLRVWKYLSVRKSRKEKKKDITDIHHLPETSSILKPFPPIQSVLLPRRL